MNDEKVVSLTEWRKSKDDALKNESFEIKTNLELTSNELIKESQRIIHMLSTMPLNTELMNRSKEILEEILLRLDSQHEGLQELIDQKTQTGEKFSQLTPYL